MNSDGDDLLYSAKRILVLAPHPDDETLGCGGTIARYARMGKEVCVVIISKGEAVNIKADNIAALRKKEAYKASEILGISRLVLLDFPDAALNRHYDEVKESIRNEIRTYAPDIVFSPSPMDFHDDHIAVANITKTLMKEFNSFDAAFYEIYSPIRYNRIIDITDVIKIKEKAVLCYKYSLLEKPESMLFAIKGLNAYRSFNLLREGFFEVFYVMKPTDIEDEVIDWLTYGLSREASAYKYLSQLKKVDQLLADYQQSLKKIEELRAGEKKTGQSESKLNDMEDSAALKIADKFYGMRDSIFPYNSKRRLFYESVVKKIKSRL
jgi:N-acetylglucosamine malate deacetylase 1